MDKYLIVGLGVFGRELALDLIEKGAEVIAVDKNMELVEDIQEMVTYAIKLDATDEKALGSIGVDDIDVAVVCIGEHFESNLLAAVNLKQHGAQKVIARAANVVHKKILQAVGVDMVIAPDIEAAERLSYRLFHKGLLDITFMGGEMVSVKMKTPKSFVGKTLAEIALRREYGVNLIAVHSPEKPEDEKDQSMEVNDNPHGDTEIKEGDVLVIVGKKKDLVRLTKKD